MTPDQGVVKNFQPIVGTAAGIVNGPGGVVDRPPQMQWDAPNDVLNQAWASAGQAMQYAPDMTPYQQSMSRTSGDMYNTQIDPSTINLPQFNAQSFQPGQFVNPSFGAVPQVSAPAGLTTSMYQPQSVQAPQIYTPQQVQAAMVSAPGAVDKISGIANVNAPNLNNYQMGPYQAVSAPTLQNYAMQAAPNVSASQINAPQSWTDPGTAAQYMSPYVQNVVDTQLAQARTQEQQQLGMQGAQAAAAGAFGGSRQGVEAANTSIGYQQMAANLQAQGLQNAYTAGTQQFNTQQQMAMQQQQANQQANLQAGLANQQAQQQAAIQNLASQLQTQQLGAQTGLQAQLANQQAGLTVAGQNLGANLQTQQLGATTGLQAALANQQMSYQQQLANQQAQEFGYGQQMQASLANQQTGLAAQQMNQQAGLQAGLAGMQYQYGASMANAQNALSAGLQNQQLQAQLAQFGAGQQMQAGLANQAAGMQAAGMTYGGALQGALQSQQLGLSGAEFGGQLGLNAAAQGYGLRQAQQGLNMNALMNQSALQNQAANLGLAGYNAQLAGNAAGLNAGQSQQNYDQFVRNTQFQNQMMTSQLPLQNEMMLAQITGMMPQGYTTNTNYTGTQVYQPPQQSLLSQAINAGIGAAGAFGSLGWKPFGAKGGLTQKIVAGPRRRAGLAGIDRAARRHGVGLAA